MIITNNLGKVAVTPRGEYDERATYNYLDIVTFNGSSYLVLQQITGSAPPNSNFYQLLSMSGDAATVADLFDPTASYSKGDYCLYDGELYRFTSDKNAGGWDSSVVEQVVVCGELNNRVEKDSIQNAGIFSETYTTIFDTATVSTSIHSNKDNPWVLLTSTNDLVTWTKSYRITFDGNVYVIIGQEWHSDAQIGKGVSFVGNASLWGNVDGILEGINNVQFLVTSGMDDGASHTEGLYLFTASAGSHTIKIESIEYDYTMLPMDLIYGFPHPAVHMVKGTSSYIAYSMGENALSNKRATFAIGYHNTLSAPASRAFGGTNTVSGENGMAIGSLNTVSGSYACAFGTNNIASGELSAAIGQNSTSSGMGSATIGNGNTASGQYSSAFGLQTNASGAGSMTFGNLSSASGAVSTAFGVRTISNHAGQFVFGTCNVADPSENPSTEKGDYVEIVGNGVNKDNRSNARTLDWEGNESLAGGLTLGMGTADEVSITAQQLQQLLALLN